MRSGPASGPSWACRSPWLPPATCWRGCGRAGSVSSRRAFRPALRTTRRTSGDRSRSSSASRPAASEPPGWPRTSSGVRLPMLGAADSLNVAAAAAILLYEARRQRDAVDREPPRDSADVLAGPLARPVPPAVHHAEAPGRPRPILRAMTPLFTAAASAACDRSASPRLRLPSRAVLGDHAARRRPGRGRGPTGADLHGRAGHPGSRRPPGTPAARPSSPSSSRA